MTFYFTLFCQASPIYFFLEKFLPASVFHWFTHKIYPSIYFSLVTMFVLYKAWPLGGCENWSAAHSYHTFLSWFVPIPPCPFFTRQCPRVVCGEHLGGSSQGMIWEGLQQSWLSIAYTVHESHGNTSSVPPILMLPSDTWKTNQKHRLC